MFSVQGISYVLLITTLNVKAGADGGRRGVLNIGGNPRGGREATSFGDFDQSDRGSTPPSLQVSASPTPNTQVSSSPPKRRPPADLVLAGSPAACCK